MRYKLFNSLAVTFVACGAVALVASLPPWAPAVALAAAAIAAWQGASAKTGFRDRAEKLRQAAGQPRYRDDEPDDA